jgi:uncharacterized protein YjeT (DUF2065 family)
MTPKPPVKRPRGRPTVWGPSGQRYNVTLTKPVATELRRLGEGSISAGIVALFQIHRK